MTQVDHPKTDEQKNTELLNRIVALEAACFGPVNEDGINALTRITNLEIAVGDLLDKTKLT